MEYRFHFLAGAGCCWAGRRTEPASRLALESSTGQVHMARIHIAVAGRGAAGV